MFVPDYSRLVLGFVSRSVDKEIFLHFLGKVFPWERHI
jgi:hypothetical protein